MTSAQWPLLCVGVWVGGWVGVCVRRCGCVWVRVGVWVCVCGWVGGCARVCSGAPLWACQTRPNLQLLLTC